MYLGGTEIPDGNGLKLGANQVDKIMLGTEQVWINNYVSDAPTGFTASEDGTATITFNWTLPVDDGVPDATYEVTNGAGTVVATAGVGTATASLVTTVSTSDTYKVRGVNIAGSSADSNTDAGTSYVGPPSPVTITASGDYTAGVDFPASIDLTICMCGGGGSGALGWYQNSDNVGGGHAGVVTSGVINHPADTIITATIGAGGTPRTGATGGGNTGGITSFDTLTSAGGVGGTYKSASFAGNGEPVTTCGGTSNNGTMSVKQSNTDWGGESSGFGDGGYGANSAQTSGGTGGIGSGGGSNIMQSGNTGTTGAGGAGQIVISWT